MTIESATYLSQLSPTWPASGDPKSEGDDHLRLIKTVLKNTFPSFTAAAMTSSDAELSALHSAGATNNDFVKLHAISATAAELNKLSGATVVTAELNTLASSGISNADLVKLHAVSSTASELNKLSGATFAVAELNALAGQGCVAADFAKLHAIGAAAADLAAMADGSGTVTYGTGWGTNALAIQCRKSVDGFVMFAIDATQTSGLGGATLATLPAGFRPATATYIYGRRQANSVESAALFKIQTTGVINIIGVVPGGTIGDQYQISGVFPTR